MRSSVLFILLSIYLSGCGKILAPKKRKKPRLKALGNPQFLTLEDQNCDLNAGDSYFSEQVIVKLSNDQGELQDYTLDLSTVSMLGLQHESTNAAVYGAEEFNLSEFYEDLSESNNSMSSLSARSPFQILSYCRPDGGYQSDSLEHAGLAALVAIKASYESYQKTRFAGKKSLRKINLAILPKLYDHNLSQYVKTFSVNNAIFTGSSLANPIITLLPHSHSWSKRYTNFWETPAITAHEYGHFVFHQYSDRIYEKLKKFLAKKSDDVFVNVMFGFEEGFADLFSYYSLLIDGRLTPNLWNLPNRDLKQNMLYYDSAHRFMRKAFDESLMSELEDGDKGDKYPRCEIHQLGAIMAYTFNHLLDSLGFEGQNIQKLELMIQWLSNLDQDADLLPKLPVKEFIKHSVKSLAELAMNKSKYEQLEPISDESLIRRLNQLFPCCADDLSELLVSG